MNNVRVIPSKCLIDYLGIIVNGVHAPTRKAKQIAETTPCNGGAFFVYRRLQDNRRRAHLYLYTPIIQEANKHES